MEISKRPKTQKTCCWNNLNSRKAESGNNSTSRRPYVACERGLGMMLCNHRSSHSSAHTRFMLLLARQPGKGVALHGRVGRVSAISFNAHNE